MIDTKRPRPDRDLDDYEPQEDKLSDRIFNWSVVTRDRGWRSASCMSVEGRYRPPALTEAEEQERRRPKWVADIADAWQVEDAWKELPALYRFCLQFVYLKRWEPRKVWRKLQPFRTHKLKHRDYDEVLRLARFALLNQLRRNGNAITLFGDHGHGSDL